MAKRPRKSKPAPKMEVHQVAIAALTPYEANPRQHTERDIDRLAKMIKAYGFRVPLLVRLSSGLIVDGHLRWRAAQKVPGLDELPCLDADDMTEAQIRGFRIAVNKSVLWSDWDEERLADELSWLRGEGMDLELTGFGLDELPDILGDDDERYVPPAGLPSVQARKSLAERFGVPPFSVLDARQGYWQQRKGAWLALGIKSELGRGANLLNFSDTILQPDPDKRGKGLTPELGGRPDNPAAVIPNFYAKKRKLGSDEAVIEAWLAKQKKSKARAINTSEWVKDKVDAGEMDVHKGKRGLAANFDGTSIFDPVLCELIYRWFSPPGGFVLDPFAGGSVRGIVAASLGRRYLGIDLSKAQLRANRQNAKSIAGLDPSPLWREGDAINLGRHMKRNRADLIFSCPPYADLERYSDDPRDLSTMSYPAFLKAYQKIIGLAVEHLEPDRFACFVVGEVRDKGGRYRGFVPDTIDAFEAAGARFYNEGILVQPVGSLPIRAAKQMTKSRKLGKAHQNVLVFVKGDPAKATRAIGEIEFGEISAAPAESDREAIEV